METRLNKDRCPGDAFISVVVVVVVGGGVVPFVVAFLVVSSESSSISSGRWGVLVLIFSCVTLVVASIQKRGVRKVRWWCSLLFARGLMVSCLCVLVSLQTQKYILFPDLCSTDCDFWERILSLNVHFFIYSFIKKEGCFGFVCFKLCVNYFVSSYLKTKTREE